MTLEGFTEKDMIIVEAGRKVAVAFGRALFDTIHNKNSPQADWEAFADELSTFIMLTEK